MFLDDQGKPPPKQITPVAPGSYESAAIILLSDGRRTTGVDTLEAAKMAAERGVRIHVVGLGTPDGHAAMGEGAAQGRGLVVHDSRHLRRRSMPRRIQDLTEPRGAAKWSANSEQERPWK